MKIYYISPHFDDAIGSCGGKINNDRVNGNDVYVVTIFSRVTAPFSDYAKSLHDYWNLVDPFNDRKKENLDACESIGAKVLNLEYEDAIYRKKDNIYLYPKDGDIFKEISPSDIALIDEMYVYFKENFNIKDKYYFPMAIGNHVDHCIVNIIGKRLKKAGYNVIFYSDFSYEGKKIIKNVNKQVFELSEDDINAKINAITKYKSQIFMLFESIDKIEDYYKVKLKGKEIFYE